MKRQAVVLSMLTLTGLPHTFTRHHKMCGFIAVLQDRPTVTTTAARRALATIAHRGPDASGEWRDGDVFLGHRRLSIIDLATGDQPMHGGDNRYVIVFNGEIYNFDELRANLVKQGATFSTRSDTEVILQGYQRWGPDVVERLHGMFAFVIWDRLRQTAFGARIDSVSSHCAGRCTRARCWWHRHWSP